MLLDTDVHNYSQEEGTEGNNIVHAQTWRFDRFWLTQKGGITYRKNSRFHNVKKVAAAPPMLEYKLESDSVWYHDILTEIICQAKTRKFSRAEVVRTWNRTTRIKKRVVGKNATQKYRNQPKGVFEHFTHLYPYESTAGPYINYIWKCTLQ